MTLSPATGARVLKMGFVFACMGLAPTLTACARPHPTPDSIVQVAGIRAKLVGSSRSGDRIQLVVEPGAEIVSALSAFITANHFVAVHFEGFSAATTTR